MDRIPSNVVHDQSNAAQLADKKADINTLRRALNLTFQHPGNHSNANFRDAIVQLRNSPFCSEEVQLRIKQYDARIAYLNQDDIPFVFSKSYFVGLNEAELTKLFAYNTEHVNGGNLTALFFVALMHLHGYGTPQNTEKAIDCLLKLYRQVPFSCYEFRERTRFLTFFYSLLLNGNVINDNNKTNIEEFLHDESKDKENTFARPSIRQAYLGLVIYYHQTGNPKKLEESLSTFLSLLDNYVVPPGEDKKSTEKSDFLVEILCRYPDIRKIDRRCNKYLIEAAERGHHEAAWEVAHFSWYDRPMEFNKPEYIRFALTSTDPVFLVRVAFDYLNGNEDLGIEKNRGFAEELFKRAVTCGSIDAGFVLERLAAPPIELIQEVSSTPIKKSDTSETSTENQETKELLYQLMSKRIAEADPHFLFGLGCLFWVDNSQLGYKQNEFLALELFKLAEINGNQSIKDICNAITKKSWFVQPDYIQTEPLYLAMKDNFIAISNEFKQHFLTVDNSL